MMGDIVSWIGSCIDSVLSRWTPKSLSHALNGMWFAPISVDGLSMRQAHEREPTTNTSVLASFSLSLFWIVHALIDSTPRENEEKKYGSGVTHTWPIEQSWPSYSYPDKSILCIIYFCVIHLTKRALHGTRLPWNVTLDRILWALRGTRLCMGSSFYGCRIGPDYHGHSSSSSSIP